MIANLMKPLTLGLIVALFFAIHWAIPSFYSTLWQLTVSHDIPGLTSYISSFGSVAVVLMILLIVLDRKSTRLNSSHLSDRKSVV